MLAFDLLKSGVLRLLPPKPPKPENRCEHHYPNRGRCQLPIEDGSELFCGRHAKSGKLSRSGRTREEREAELRALAVEIYGPVKNLSSAVALNHALDNLFRLTIEGRVPQRKAALLTYMSRQLLNTVHSKRDEISSTRIFPSLHPDIANLLAILGAPFSGEAAVADGRKWGLSPNHSAADQAEPIVASHPEQACREGSAGDPTPAVIPSGFQQESGRDLDAKTSSDPESEHRAVAAEACAVAESHACHEDSPASTQNPNRKESADLSTAADQAHVAPNSSSAASESSFQEINRTESVQSPPSPAQRDQRTGDEVAQRANPADAPHQSAQPEFTNQSGRARRANHLPAGGDRIPAQRDQRDTSAGASSDEFFRSKNRGSKETRKKWFSKWFSKTEQNPASPDNHSAHASSRRHFPNDDLSRADFAKEANFAARDEFGDFSDFESTSTGLLASEIRYTYQESLEEAQRNSRPILHPVDNVCWIGPKPDQINWARLVYEQREYDRYLRETYGVTFNGRHLVPPDKRPLWWKLRKPR